MTHQILIPNAVKRQPNMVYFVDKIGNLCQAEMHKKKPEILESQPQPVKTIEPTTRQDNPASKPSPDNKTFLGKLKKVFHPI